MAVLLVHVAAFAIFLTTLLTTHSETLAQCLPVVGLAAFWCLYVVWKGRFFHHVAVEEHVKARSAAGGNA